MAIATLRLEMSGVHPRGKDKKATHCIQAQPAVHSGGPRQAKQMRGEERGGGGEGWGTGIRGEVGGWVCSRAQKLLDSVLKADGWSHMPSRDLIAQLWTWL